MLAYRLLTTAGLLAFVLIMITQVILPALRGTQLFPALRREGRIRQWVAARRQLARERALFNEEGERDE